jgi:hypothetical protein
MSEKRMLACSKVSERARAVAWDPAPGGGGLLAVRLNLLVFAHSIHCCSLYSLERLYY